MHKHLYNEIQLRIGSDAETIIMENAAVFLKPTVKYYDESQKGMSDKFIMSRTRGQYSAVAILAMGVPLYEYWQIVPPSKYSEFIVRLDPEMV